MNIYTPTYLYIKQHTVTGKLYFGKFSRTDISIDEYLGSGKHWLRHINKHGKEHVVTLWYCLFLDQESCTEFAEKFSEQENIVESNIWLNLIPENGLNGMPIGLIRGELHCERISRSKLGIKNAKIAGSNHYQFGKHLSTERKSKCASKGSSNGRAVCIEAIDQYGINYIINGDMRLFAREHNLCYDTIRKQARTGHKPVRGENKNWSFKYQVHAQ